MINFQYPAWYIIFCVLLGIGIALLLYYRDQTFKEQPSWLKWLLGAIRTTAITFLAILLLSPFLKSIFTESKLPIVILAQDVSESIRSEMEATELEGYQQNIEQLSNDLSGNYDLKQYEFGSDIREGLNFDFTDKSTNLSAFFNEVQDIYSNQNLGAIILASDGIYNEGSNPIYTNTKINAPIYTVALGDTTPKKDLVLKRVFHNKIAYLEDKFTIQVDIAAQNASGNTTRLSIAKVNGASSQTIEQEAITIDRNDFFITKEVVLDANQAGVQRYRISLASIDGEASTRNNRRDIFIDVLDARQQILILAAAPHPDVAALRQSLANNKNYELTVKYAKDQIKNINDYDFVILHQLPTFSNVSDALISDLQKEKIPHLFVVGTQTNTRKLNEIQSLINIKAPSKNTNEVQAILANNFSAFIIEDEIKQQVPIFPPLIAPFGEFTSSGNAQILLYQRIGKIDTKYPLLVVGEQNSLRQGVLCAEGVWKWRLFNFLQEQNHNVFDDLLGKSVQYLSIKEDKRKFRVNLDKAIFSDNENIIFDAELYNDNFELINDPDASLTIKDADNKDYNFTFDKTSNTYRLDAGSFPEGNYRFGASVNYNGQSLNYEGQFSIEPIQLEVYETTADHRLLALLSDKYGGQMIYPGNIASLGSIIKDKETIKPVIYESSKTEPIINLKWIFFLLGFLLVLEWFLRRYNGGY